MQIEIYILYLVRPFERPWTCQHKYYVVKLLPNTGVITLDEAPNSRVLQGSYAFFPVTFSLDAFGPPGSSVLGRLVSFRKGGKKN